MWQNCGRGTSLVLKLHLLCKGEERRICEAVGCNCEGTSFVHYGLERSKIFCNAGQQKVNEQQSLLTRVVVECTGSGWWFLCRGV